MFSWIGLIFAKIKLKYKEKILKRTANREKRLGFVSRNRSKELKKVKAQNRIVNFAIGFNIILGIAIVIIIGTAIFGMILFLQGSIATNQIIYDDTYAEENEKGEWDFSSKDENGFFEENTDGNYPKDYTLKIRAQLMEIIRSAIDVAKEQEVADWRNYDPEPAWILGVSNRETNGRLYNYFIDEKYDLMNSLVMTDDPCGKILANGCGYIKNGLSHYEGGSVVNGKDTGSPYTSKFDMDNTKYNAAGRNHAIGPFQFESNYVYSHAESIYGQFGKVEPYMDEDLGFMRPNPLYVPDAVQGIANKRLWNYQTIYTNNMMIQNNEPTKKGNRFKDLNKRQQNQIYWAVAGPINGFGGEWKPEYDEMIEVMIDFTAEGGDLEHLISEEHYNADTHKVDYPSHQSLIDQFNAAGLKFESVEQYKGTTYYYAMYYGVEELNLGRLEYDKLAKEIADAEKEDGGALGSGNSTDILPLKSGVIFSYFGYRGTGQLGYHRGMDFATNHQSIPIYMPVDGVITETNSVKVNGSIYDATRLETCGPVSNLWNGNYIEFQPVNKPWLSVILCHMADLPQIEIDGKTVYIKDLPAGTVIKAGTQVGMTGTTGCSDGIHLHFEVNVEDNSKEELVYNTNNDGAYTGRAIPPLHALYGDIADEIILNSEIGLGNQNQMKDLNDKIYWRSKNLNAYMWFSLDEKEDSK